MKYAYVIFILAITLLGGCKSDSKSENDRSAVGDDSRSTSSSSREWSSSDQQSFLDDCTPAAAKTLGQGYGKRYCNCMLQKIMKEYPNLKEAGKMSDSRMDELANECNKDL